MAKSPEEEHPIKTVGWASSDSSGVLAPFNFSRRETGEKDVQLKVLFCGVCHSDLHGAKNDWGNTLFPIVPGHEIVGIVTDVGAKVEKFKLGDRVGVGVIIGSCMSCHSCSNNEENYCPNMIFTYNSIYFDGTKTYGGFSDIMVVDEHFAVHIPESLPLDATAPLLCAGITVYSPLKYYGLDKPGTHVGVVGLGGLGHFAVKFAKAMGCKVTVISTSLCKKYEAIKGLGADEFLVSHNEAQIKAAVGTLDGIIDTVSANHSVVQMLELLKSNGKLVLVGLPVKPFEVDAFTLVHGRKILAGSCIGGIKETQEMLDFAAERNITADIELIRFDYLNEAMARLAKADVKYRFVIDVANSIGSASL